MRSAASNRKIFAFNKQMIKNRKQNKHKKNKNKAIEKGKKNADIILYPFVLATFRPNFEGLHQFHRPFFNSLEEKAFAKMNCKLWFSKLLTPSGKSCQNQTHDERVTQLPSKNITLKRII